MIILYLEGKPLKKILPDAQDLHLIFINWLISLAKCDLQKIKE